MKTHAKLFLKLIILSLSGHFIFKTSPWAVVRFSKLKDFLEEEKSLLFNLKQDPEEQDNLIDIKPEIGEYLLDLIKTNLKRANERIRANNQLG